MSNRVFVIALLMLSFGAVSAVKAKAGSGTSAVSGFAQSDIKIPIERGFNLLYELKFDEARAQFEQWKAEHPDDPLGDVSIAVGYLFEELYHHDVLTSEFFLDNKRLFGGIEGKPDEDRTRRFKEAVQRGIESARQELKKNPNDADALFALALATGSQANYAAMLEKQQRKSLRLLREHENQAKRVLELRPDLGDAWLAVGTTNYLIGSLPVYIRIVLWFGRINGDKDYGMEKLRVAAAEGHYLRPFAKIFLALADLREKREDEARQQLLDLVTEFPENHLFADELAKLTKHPESSEKPKAQETASERKSQ